VVWWGCPGGAGGPAGAPPRHIPAEDLIGCLDEGGYARCDLRTADRLLALSEVIGERYGGQAA
jgi:hypothetical protein